MPGLATGTFEKESRIVSTDQKVALITGASQGIGAVLVKGFLDRGYRVVANSRTIEPAAPGSPDLLTVAGDLAYPESAERIVGAAIDRFGRIDTLVNNAGIFIPKPVDDIVSRIESTPDEPSKIGGERWL